MPESFRDENKKYFFDILHQLIDFNSAMPRDVKRKSSSARQSPTTDTHSQLFQALSLRCISSRIKMIARCMQQGVGKMLSSAFDHLIVSDS
uniref:Uncharacterized protein n=1 Tax=Daphnia galeata TaxID=27404 RepID=A0A8J2RUE6_9CRUS|nr:unnamed protein product [Daphnia galeata]